MVRFLMTQFSKAKNLLPIFSLKSHIEHVKKRDGSIVDFNEEKIISAISRAMEASGEGDVTRDPKRVADYVVSKLTKQFPAPQIPHIEQIQDVVEEALIIDDFPKTAKGYILYRNKRAELREVRREIPEHVKKLVEESRSYFRNPLAEFIYYRTYSRWIDEEGRRETWIESVDRYIQFMKDNLGGRLSGGEYAELREAILRHEVMPSMRLLWSAGRAAKTTHASAYNCSFIAPTKTEDFAEI